MRAARTMIYDCFTFFNELELLELRLHELSGVVDKFVLVEATRTHSNQPKALVYQENRARFQDFHEKIIHVVVDDMPNAKNAWVLENFQRECIARGLVNCRPDDCVLVSDLDEIPRATTVTRAAQELPFQDSIISNILHGTLNSRLVTRLLRMKGIRRFARKYNPFVLRFQQRQYWHFMNCKMARFLTFGTRMVRYRDFSSAEELRHSGYRIIENGGWHFSFMGGAERIREKLLAYAHQERNRPEFTDVKAIDERINRGASVWNADWKFEFVPLDDSFPRYLLEHRDAFAHWIKPTEGNQAGSAAAGL